MRAIVSLPLLAAVAAALVAQPATAATAIPKPLILPGPVVAMAATPDGAVHVVMVPSRKTFKVATISPAGALQPPKTLRVAGGADTTAVAVGADGSAFFASWAAGHGKSGSSSWTTVSPTGVASPPRPLAGLGAKSIPTAVTIAPNGAVAVLSQVTSTGGSVPTLLYKPAGASDFGPPVSLGPAQSAKQVGQSGSAYDVALGPDGGGAVAIEHFGTPLTPEPTLRTISPAGDVGPDLQVPIGQHFVVPMKLAVAPSGTIAVLLGIVDLTSDPNDDGEEFHSKVFLGTLAPGASTVAVQQLGTDLLVTDSGSSADFAIGAGDQAVVLGTADVQGIHAFRGPLTALTALPVILSSNAIATKAVVGEDGTATAVWVHLFSGLSGSSLVSATAPVDGPFGTMLTRTSSTKAAHDPALDAHPVALPGGAVGVAYSVAVGKKKTQSRYVRLTP